MSVVADIILISTAIQSNGILSYTLNIFKTKHLLKSSCQTFATLFATHNATNSLSVINQREGNAKIQFRLALSPSLRRAITDSTLQSGLQWT